MSYDKYLRYQPVVSKNSDADLDENHWLRQFEKKLQKGGVQSRSVEQSFIDQMNSIMNSKSKYPSVEAAVEEMKQRSGLTDYLNKLSEKEITTKKVAQDNNLSSRKEKDRVPKVIEKCPKIKMTLENYVRDNRGNSSIPAIIDKIKSIHSKDVPNAADWEDDALLRLVSHLNLEAKKNHPDEDNNFSNLGRRDNIGESEIDPSNTDAFHALMPAKM